MTNVSLFFNTKIEGSGLFAAIGDIGLTPVRYLFDGQTVCIAPIRGSEEVKIHHVASFHKRGNENKSATNCGLHSSSTGKMRALAAVALLIPGLVLSVFKLLAYLFNDMRQRHRLAKEHFTPINREIGSPSRPITYDTLERALAQDDPKHRPIDTLTIHGDGNLTLYEDPGIRALNPKKLKLDGVFLNFSDRSFSPIRHLI